MRESEPHTGERSESVWKRNHPLPHQPPLDADAECDLCVVGAGIAGLSVAYEAARRGRTVIVLDQRAAGTGETAQTTAHLSSALDEGFVELERVHGRLGARLAFRSHDAAIDRIGAICEAEDIECRYERVDGFLVLGVGQKRQRLEQELEAAARAGAHGLELLPRVPFAQLTWDAPCIRFARQGQLNPLEYVGGLARVISDRYGVRIFGDTHVTDVEEGAVIHVRTARGPIVRCRHVAVCTNSPINDRFAIHTKQAPYRTFAIGLAVEPGVVPRALFWDTLDPYHYVRLAEVDGGEVLVVGGEDHKTGWEDDAPVRFQRLEDWTRARFPMAGERILRWSGQVLEPFDGPAFIGRNPGSGDNVFVATGDSGHGMTHGVLAGMLIAELLDGNQHPFAKLYDPSRKSLRAIGEYARINAGVATRLTDWLRRGDQPSLEAIPAGGGAVIADGLQKLAVYRHDDGSLSACSASCPHLGCVVHWNSTERSWDCPCHGSRFSPTGAVLNGPALGGLEPVVLPGERPESEPPTS